MQNREKSNAFIEMSNVPASADANIIGQRVETRLVLDEAFQFGFTIDPIRENGMVKAFRPYEQPQYAGRNLHRYGGGPFCAFSAHVMSYESDIYLLMINGDVM